jgi:diguanylate cyclase (GGDEF)-like protein/PAS domain S-box-containing protein
LEKSLFASIRLALGIAGVSVAVALSAQWLGLLSHALVSLLTIIILSACGLRTIDAIRRPAGDQESELAPDRFRQALDTLVDGLVMLDEQGRIVLANHTFATSVGQSSDDLTGQWISKLPWISIGVADPAFPWTLAIEHSSRQAERMLCYQAPDGSERIFSVNVAPLVAHDPQRGVLATFRDVTHVEQHRADLERMLHLLQNSRDEIKRKNGELELLATQDALTGCLNRRAFFETFEARWAESKMFGTPLACLMIDIDHFKNINDSYGHHTGDEVLRQVAKIIRRLYDDRGIICRYGGEEFCVILPGADLAEAIVTAEATRLAITNFRLPNRIDRQLSVSVGVSELRFSAEDPQELINQADVCLYIAKREGRNRVIAYNLTMATGEPMQQEQPRERIEIPYQAVMALVSALSYRDAKTAEHSRRVADLCSRAAVDLLNPAQSYLIEVAALLHDIGKIGVPDEILWKQSKLTAEEWEVMSRHDRIGKDLIQIAFNCPDLTEIATNHHAFYGGDSRHPDLPTGDRIPLAARLLAIADSYDAMTSEQCYRSGHRTHEEAIAELRRCAGSQFDPDLVEHFATKIIPGEEEITLGALAIQKQAAFALGAKMEKLAAAIARRDAVTLLELAIDLSQTGRELSFQEIESMADKIRLTAADEETQWVSLIRDTYDLMDLCRSAQCQFLQNSLEAEAAQVNETGGTAIDVGPRPHMRAT